MTENKRIVLNTLATYIRSVYGLLCGLFTSRWVLMSLGHVDFGLYGVVGGLVVFISFFNGVLSAAIARFYTFSVGQSQASVDKQAGLEECRRWFNTAVTVHTVVPLVLVLIGYPVGVWAVKHFLSIPPDRIVPCIWVFRFSCISCFLSMINVPFNAMYTAKQFIAELTIYSFATSTINVAGLHFMVTHPGDWLVKYALFMSIMTIVPQIIICVRAIAIFPECRLEKKYMCDWHYLRRLGTFAGGQLIGGLSGLLRGQGMAILVNKFYGPSVNSAMNIANTINAQSSTLASAMVGAFSPAITSAYGAGEIDRMKSMSLRACKFGAVLSLVFVIPLGIEINEVLNLWLKDPPRFTAGLALIMLVTHLIETMTQGHMIAVGASGKIALYQALMGIVSLLALPMAFLWFCQGGDPYVAGLSILITVIIYTFVRVGLTERIVGLSVRLWLTSVVCPILILSGTALCVGVIPRFIMGPSLLRIVITTVSVESVLLPLIWFAALNEAERLFIRGRLLARLRR